MMLSLSQDLLLLAFEWLPAQELCCLAQLCQMLSANEQLSSDPAGTPLTLPEHVARRQVERAYAVGETSLRRYERGEPEPWCQVLLLLERGLLASGVLLDVPACAIDSASGWKVAYSNAYAHRTNDADIDAVPADARYVMLAALDESGTCHSDGQHRPAPSQEQLKDGSAQSFVLLAWGKREIVLRTTHEAFSGGRTTTDNFEDGVFYYRWREHAMGFSSDPALFLYFADSGCKRGMQEVRPEHRLSWNLENVSTGGWRAGRWTDLGNSNHVRKMVYYRM